MPNIPNAMAISEFITVVMVSLQTATSHILNRLFI